MTSDEAVYLVGFLASGLGVGVVMHGLGLVLSIVRRR